MTRQPYRIFISAAEPSGERHCASLIEALHASSVPIECTGVGGPKMEAAGCRLLQTTTTRAAMSLNAVKEVGFYLKLLGEIRRHFQDHPVDLVIVCDSPAFNFHVAKAAKQAGTQTLFYVAPQLWAWAAWRIRKLKRTCDKLCCILPFEEAWFRARGVDAVFVSNPLLDDVGLDLTPHIKDYSCFDPRRVRLALMPGSRSAEIAALWEPMQQITLQLQQAFPGLQCVTVAATQARRDQLRHSLVPGFTCDFSVDSVMDTARQVDFALVASGSATLEVATAGCPMLVMYQGNRLIWHAWARWAIKTPFLSLVNILADRELVPEFMPYFRSIDPLVAKAHDLIVQPQELARISRSLITVTQPLAQRHSARTVAGIVLNMLEQSSHESAPV